MEQPTDSIRQRATSLAWKMKSQIRQVIRATEMEQCRGEGVFCPVCNQPFSHFAPEYQWIYSSSEHGGMECRKISETGRCPACDSLNRQRLLWKYLHEKTSLFNGTHTTLLEVAPDLTFFNLFSGLPYLNYYPCDLFPDDEHFNDYPGKILEADLCHLPFADEFFGVVLCSHVLEHVEDDAVALSEIHRVLKPDGWAILQVPVLYTLEHTLENPLLTTPEQREAAFGQADHRRKYGRDYKTRLEKAGFKVAEIACTSLYSPSEVATFGLDAYEKINLCARH